MNLSKVIDSTSLIRTPEQTSGELSEVLSRLHDLKGFYPDFDTWITDKVLPGITVGERSILTEYRDGELAALAIVKDDGLEKKLCSLRVLPGYQNSRGIGVRMFERSFELLDTAMPLLSVAQEQMPKFDRLFTHFGFAKSGEHMGLYRPGVTEFAFNGTLHDTVRAARGLELSAAPLR